MKILTDIYYAASAFSALVIALSIGHGTYDSWFWISLGWVITGLVLASVEGFIVGRRRISTRHAGIKRLNREMRRYQASDRESRSRA